MANDVSVKSSGGMKNYISPLVIILAIVVGYCIYFFVMGSPGNFEGGDPTKHPLQGNKLGLMYKGGILVGMALAMMIMVLTFTVERLLTISAAKGKGSIDVFVKKIQMALDADDIKGAIAECDAQRGSVANVVKSGLLSYEQMAKDKDTDKEKRILTIQKAFSEASALEMPMMEKNLTIISTIVSVATLLGLIGTVLGMIGAFSAMATSGAPDAVALSNGISEALINTLLGIGTSTIATVVYNYFTSEIDGMKYSVEEVGYSIVQTFAAKH